MNVPALAEPQRLPLTAPGPRLPGHAGDLLAVLQIRRAAVEVDPLGASPEGGLLVLYATTQHRGETGRQGEMSSPDQKQPPRRRLKNRPSASNARGHAGGVNEAEPEQPGSSRLVLGLGGT